MKMQTAQNIEHHYSSIDQFMVDAIENHTLQLAEFSHATHIKLAYCYLTKFGLEASKELMEKTLKNFLSHNSIDPNKYHKTLTQAWLIAVWHFMQKTDEMHAADEFLEYNPVLLNKDILLSHYSYERLYSEQARKQFIEPDLNELPEYHWYLVIS